MKKHLLLAALGILGSILPAMARDFTYTYEGQTITYTILDEDAKTVKTKEGSRSQGGNEVTGTLVLPETVYYNNQSYTLTTLGDYAFYGCSGLTSVTLPNSVTTIWSYAFNSCTGLTSITLPSSLTTLGFSVFCKCASLTSITLPNSLTEILSAAFHSCTGLTSITLPNSLTTIGQYAFKDCTSLTSITLPNSVNTIEEGAFHSCTGLTSITLPNSLTTIEYAAFEDCTGLTSITLPNLLSKIGERAFEDCRGLTSIYYDAEEPIAASYYVFDSWTYYNAVLYANQKAIEKYKAIDPWKNFKTISPIESGIDEISADAAAEPTVAGYWNIQGVRSDKPYRGLNIVRYSDGTVRKEVR